MKKILVLLIVLLLAGGLFAQGEESKSDPLKFKYNGMLYIYNTRQRSVDGGDPIAFWETRVRQYLSIGNKNYGVVTKFEIDPTWGDGAGSGNVKVGADMKGELQIKNAYLYFKVPNMPLKVRAGIHFHMSPGMFMFADDIGGISVDYKSKALDVNAVYCKMGEYNDNQFSDDAEMAGVNVSLKMGSMTITPALYYYYVGSGVDSGAAGPYGAGSYRGIFTRNAFIPQVGLKMKSGGLDLSATVAYGFGKIKDGGDQDASGLGVDLKLSFKVGSGFKIGFIASYLSGDDAGTADSENFAQFMPGLVQGLGVRLVGTSLFLQGGLTAHPYEALGADAVYTYGLLMSGVKACLNIGKLSVKVTGAWLSSAEEYSAGNKSYGIEADVIVEYTLYKNLKLQAEASYFLPSSDYQAAVGTLPDVCSFYAVGTTFKW